MGFLVNRAVNPSVNAVPVNTIAPPKYIGSVGISPSTAAPHAAAKTGMRKVTVEAFCPAKLPHPTPWQTVALTANK